MSFRSLNINMGILLKINIFIYINILIQCILIPQVFGSALQVALLHIQLVRL
jgi:hypothetical protein